MRIDLFPIPIFIGDIDASKVIVKSKKFMRVPFSNIKTSYPEDCEATMPDKSSQYLLKCIHGLLRECIQQRFTLTLTSIWENIYEKEDFQESHIHPYHHFSFIVYKKIKQSRTAFFAPHRHLLESFYAGHYLCNVYKPNFIPECKQNQIIVFPSFLEHMVMKTSNAKTIAGNLRITGLSFKDTYKKI